MGRLEMREEQDGQWNGKRGSEVKDAKNGL